MASICRFLGFIFFLLVPVLSWAQGERADKGTPVTFEEVYDEPYKVNKLFVHFQPLYAELFATNVTAGFGLEANYYLKEKFDFKAHFRSTYGSPFFDMNRQQGKENSDVENRQKPFTYFEFGATYHIKDFEKAGKTKIVLYKKSYSGNKWAARVPLTAQVPVKVRQIYGARLGTTIWQSSLDVNNIMKKQDLTLGDFNNTNGTLEAAAIDNGNVNEQAQADLSIFSNASSAGLYVGGSVTWIRNAAFSFDKYEDGVDDLIFTTFLDILIAPSVKLDDIVYRDQTYGISPIGVTKVGFRAGIEGKFNRALSWSYGGEVGYRPGIEGRMFYALVKISFPVFGTNLDYKVESFEKAK